MDFDSKSMISQTIRSNTRLLVQLLGDISHHAHVLYENHGQHGSSDGLPALQRQLWQVDSMLTALEKMGEAKACWPTDG